MSLDTNLRNLERAFAQSPTLEALEALEAERERLGMASPPLEKLLTLLRETSEEAPPLSEILEICEGDPADLFEISEALLDTDRSADAAPIQSALYWYCSAYHEGQGSAGYSIGSRLSYSPGLLENYPQDADSREAYLALVSAQIGPIPDLLELEPDLWGLDSLGFGRERNALVVSWGENLETMAIVFDSSAEEALQFVADRMPDEDFITPDWSHCDDCEGGDPCASCFESATADLTALDNGSWILSDAWGVSEVNRLSALRSALESAKLGPYVAEIHGPSLAWDVQGEGPVSMDAYSEDQIQAEFDREDISLAAGLACRWQMPGYLDCTDTVVADSWEEAFTTLLEEDGISLPGDPE